MPTPELIPQGVALASVPGLTPRQVQFFNDCWIGTAQELVALAACPDAVKKPLCSALGIDAAALDPIVQAAQALLPVSRSPGSVQLELEAAAADYRLGALLDEPSDVLDQREKLPPYIPPSGRPVLPPSANLVGQLPPLRDQGGRGTCVAHAALSVREQLETAAGSPTDINLSEQFVYWWCKQNDGIPKASGTYVSVAMRCLSEAGAPLEQVWPYVSFSQGDEGQGPPPAAAAAGDPGFRTVRTMEFNRTDINGIKTCIAEGRVVAISVPVFDSWYYPTSTRRWGKITLPFPAENADGGHAVALVGYQDDPSTPGGGYFIVRNSWQPWAYDGVWQAGYGYMPYAYVSRYATAVFSAERITGTEVYLRDSMEDDGERPRPQLSWNSPDIWLRRSADGKTDPQAPAVGQANNLYARVSNRGPAYAYDLRLEFHAAPLSPYNLPEDWQRIARLRVEWIAPGTQVVGPASWTPAVAGPQALRVSMDSAGDALGDQLDPAVNNNVAVRRLYLLEVAAGSTGEVAFDVVRRADLPAQVNFAVNRDGLPAGVQVTDVKVAAAPTRGIVEDAVIGALTGGIMLGIGERRRATLSVTVPGNAQAGAQYLFSIAQLQVEEVVGEMAVQVTVADGT